jgi:hypothetical protein
MAEKMRRRLLLLWMGHSLHTVKNRKNPEELPLFRLLSRKSDEHNANIREREILMLVPVRPNCPLANGARPLGNSHHEINQVRTGFFWTNGPRGENPRL